MLFGFDILPVTPFWDRDNPAVLVPAMKAFDLCREEGCERLGSREAVELFERAAYSESAQTSQGGDLRTFLAHLHLPGLYLCDTKDQYLFQLVRQAIQSGAVVGLRKNDKSKQPQSETAEQRQLVRKIEQIVRGHLSYSGRQYKLVVDVELAKTPGRDSYEVVDLDDAKRVLDGVAKQSGTVPELTALLGQASEKLTKDWHPPLQPDGLILLRRIRQTSAAVKDVGPAITPSQMKAMMDKSALTIHVVDLKQKPQEGLAFTIEAPDGSTVSGKLDKEGKGRAQSSTPGDFIVSFSDLDGADWNGDGALELAEDERTEALKYKVEQGDRLPTIAKDQGFARWRTIWDFKGNADLQKLRGTAHILLPGDEVSIPSRLSRKAEVPGGSAEYVVQSAAEVLRVRIAGTKSSDANPVTFKATPDTGGAVEGTLPANGKLEVDLPPDTSKVHVELSREGTDGDQPFAAYDFTVGGLDPSDTTSGIQARLQNLGFYTGPINGDLDDATHTAIAHFRWAKLRDHKDVVDDDFLAALHATHGR